MVKASIEVVKNVDGRVESGVVIVQGRKLKFNNVWDDSGLLRRIEFDGRNVPTFSELYWFMNEKFIEKIRKIGVLDELTLLRTLETIGTIQNLPFTSAQINLVRNGDFESGLDFPWRAVGGTVAIDGTVSYQGSYSCKIQAGTLFQDIPAYYGDEVVISLWAKSDALRQIVLAVQYEDDTTETTTDAALGTSWTYEVLAPTTHKRIKFIYIQGAAGSVWVDAIAAYTFLKTMIVTATDLDIRDLTSASDSVEVKQATRTNLKIQPERTDLLLKSFDLAVGTTSLLAAVAGQYHKIYGWDYEADTDGANEFSGTFAASTYKFARRVTKGVHAMTLVHPIICDVNSALSFISAGNTKLSLRYVTEA